MKWYLQFWNNAFNFSGRARRKEFWLAQLFTYIVVMVLAMVLGGLGSILSPHGGYNIIGAILALPVILFVLFSLIPLLSVTIRRFHDINKSGWWVLLFAVLGVIPFIQIISSLVMLIFLCVDSYPQHNKWGDNPKATSHQP